MIFTCNQSKTAWANTGTKKTHYSNHFSKQTCLNEQKNLKKTSMQRWVWEENRSKPSPPFKRRNPSHGRRETHRKPTKNPRLRTAEPENVTNNRLPKNPNVLLKTQREFGGPDDLFKRIHKNPKPGFVFNFHLFPGRSFFQFSSKTGRRNPKPGYAFDEPNATFLLHNLVFAAKTLFRALSSRNQTGP